MMTDRQRARINSHARIAWDGFLAMEIEVYLDNIGVDGNLVLYVFDASSAEGDTLFKDFHKRVISHFEYGDGSEFEKVAEGKATIALRTGKESGVTVEHFPELLVESDTARYAGCVLGVVNGWQIGVTSSGLKQREDRIFSDMMLALLVRVFDKPEKEEDAKEDEASAPS